MISDKNAPRFLYLVSALQNMLFMLPVLMLFYGYKGVDMGDFFLIQGLSYLTVFVMEIPSGYVSDLCSRKTVIIMGLFSWIAGYLCWIFGSGFTFILIGELIFGLAISLISGTIEAYLYDLLKRRGKEKLFHLKNAKLATVGNAGLMIATLSGAFCYHFFGPEVTLGFSVFALLISIVIMLFMPDVPESRRKVAENKSKWKDILDISKYAVKHQQIKWLMIFPAIYGTLTLILMWGLQSVMIATHVPVFMFSIVVGLNALGRTGWSAASGILLEKWGLNKILLFLCSIISIAISAAVFSTYLSHILVYFCLGLMILGSGSIQLAKVTTSTLVNHRIKSDERATILSVKTMLERFMTAFSMIALKPLFDLYEVGEVFMISSLLLIPILCSAFYLHQLKLKIR